MKPDLYRFQVNHASAMNLSGQSSDNQFSDNQFSGKESPINEFIEIAPESVSSAPVEQFSFKLSPKKSTPNHRPSGKTVQPFPVQPLSSVQLASAQPPASLQQPLPTPEDSGRAISTPPSSLPAPESGRQPKTPVSRRNAPILPAAAPAKRLGAPPVPPRSTRQESAQVRSTPKATVARATHLLPVMQILRELEAAVLHWQDELNQLGVAIQNLYEEGPIVDGWLETHSREPKAQETKLRHIDLTLLKDYVDEICHRALNLAPRAAAPKEGYSLCGLDEEGNLWSYPCPLEQLPSVSAAIARYHRLRELQSRKQHLETNLNQLTNTLMALYTRIK